MSYYYNNENQEDPDDYDLSEGQQQIEREEQFDKYCDDIKDVHAEMIEYAQYTENPGLMEFSDYFDLMNLIEKGEYKFTPREEQNYLRKYSRYGGWGRSHHDNCVIPDPIDMTDLYLFDTFNLDTETLPKTPPKPKTPKPKTPPKPKKVLKEIKHSPTKFTGWKKQNVKIETIGDIQDNQKKDITQNKVKNNKFKPNKNKQYTNNKIRPKGKYIPPSLR
jgi:hypothetical protein